MIRRLLIATAIASLICAASAQDASIKIATVDIQELFKRYNRTNEAQKQIDAERSSIQQDNNNRLARIRDIEEGLSKLDKEMADPAVGESRRQELLKDWQTLQQEGIALDRERREFLQRKNQMLNEKMVQRMKGILEEIRKLVEERAKAGGYDFVIDKSGVTVPLQSPFLISSSDSLDLTADLLRELNEMVPAADPETPEAPDAPEAP